MVDSLKKDFKRLSILMYACIAIFLVSGFAMVIKIFNEPTFKSSSSIFLTFAVVVVMTIYNTAKMKIIESDSSQEDLIYKESRYILGKIIMYFLGLLLSILLLIVLLQEAPESLQRPLTVGDLVTTFIVFGSLYRSMILWVILHDSHVSSMKEVQTRTIEVCLAFLGSLTLCNFILAGEIQIILASISLFAVSTGGLSNFIMSFARGIKDEIDSQSMHQAGGWLLKRSIKMTLAGIALLPALIFHEEIVLQMRSTAAMFLSNHNIAKLFPVIERSSLPEKFYTDDAGFIFSLFLIIFTLLSSYIFSSTLVKSLFGMVMIKDSIDNLQENASIFEILSPINKKAKGE